MMVERDQEPEGTGEGMGLGFLEGDGLGHAGGAATS